MNDETAIPTGRSPSEPVPDPARPVRRRLRSPAVRLRQTRRRGTLHAIMTNHATMMSKGPGLDDRLLRLFADPLRAQLVALLAAEQLCTCHLADATGALPSAVSNHLRQLKEADIVESEPCGRFTYYRLRPEVLEAVSTQFAALAQAAFVAPKRPC